MTNLWLLTCKRGVEPASDWVAAATEKGSIRRCRYCGEITAVGEFPPIPLQEIPPNGFSYISRTGCLLLSEETFNILTMDVASSSWEAVALAGEGSGKLVAIRPLRGAVIRGPSAILWNCEGCSRLYYASGGPVGLYVTRRSITDEPPFASLPGSLLVTQKLLSSLIGAGLQANKQRVAIREAPTDGFAELVFRGGEFRLADSP